MSDISTEKHLNAIHKDLGAPIFPNNLAQLQELFGRGDIGWSKQAIKEAIQKMNGFKTVEIFETSDEYCWFAGAEFRLGDQTIVIAIPLAQDRGKSDGTSCDRSLAIYATHDIDDCVMATLLESVAGNLRSYSKSHCRH
jgi:hypothetical protein